MGRTTRCGVEQPHAAGKDAITVRQLLSRQAGLCGLRAQRLHGSYGPNPRAYDHDGYRGSFGLADPDNRLSVGYVMNRMGYVTMDAPRKTARVKAVYASV